MSLTKEIIAYVDSTIKRFITTSMNRVVQEAHTHPNKPLLDTLTSAGAGTLYLADDGTLGTAQNTAASFLAALGTSTDPLAVRLQNVSTVQTTGAQIAAYNV